MLINLHKSFRFIHEEDSFQVDYVFKQDEADRKEQRSNAISLLITSTKNKEAEKAETMANASTILSQSNEQIQKIVEERILASANGELIKSNLVEELT